MKRKLIVILSTILPIVLIAALLLNNKEIMENRLIDDTISVYPVKVKKVSSVKYERKLKLMGKTEAYNDIELLSETSGRILEVKIKTGDRLNKNDIIVEVDKITAEAEYKLAEVSYQKAKRDFERYKNLLVQGNLSESELENAKLNLISTEAQFKLAQKQLDNKQITAPINGIVSYKFVQQGSTIVPGSQIINIVDISRLKVNVDVPSSEITKISRGQKVDVSSDLLPGKIFNGVISSSGIKANEASAYPVEIIIHNPSEQLRAGMFVNVEFQFEHKEKINIIPRASVVGSLKSPEVFVIKNGIAVKTKIVAGEVLNDQLIVESGLKIGEKIVISGQNNLFDQCKVEITN